MKVSLASLLSKLPRQATAERPDGLFVAEAFAHGTMTLEAFAPRSEAQQTSHFQDRVFIVTRGSATTLTDGERGEVREGDALLVEAHDAFTFEATSEDFVAWIVSWGPEGGEAEAPNPSVFAAIDA
ncbi:cupin domain-containing protein [Jiella endophytica]|uniref:Cupin domain-containing protein n=1 Tax=Jiella endophytica TaxID=2558362 RepID=A0A4Y8RS83_9HYPH|nr:cupin domain-containing protein [Jiella endophytica]TFF25577.1 cupin domain-containing protein [Jiella endophytica]